MVSYIVGEICYFVDIMQFLSGSLATEVFTVAAESQRLPVDPDNLSIQLRFGNGSVGTILYVSTSDPAFPKERPLCVIHHRALHDLWWRT